MYHYFSWLDSSKYKRSISSTYFNFHDMFMCLYFMKGFIKQTDESMCAFLCRLHPFIPPVASNLLYHFNRLLSLEHRFLICINYFLQSLFVSTTTFNFFLIFRLLLMLAIMLLGKQQHSLVIIIPTMTYLERG